MLGLRKFSSETETFKFFQLSVSKKNVNLFFCCVYGCLNNAVSASGRENSIWAYYLFIKNVRKRVKK